MHLETDDQIRAAINDPSEQSKKIKLAGVLVEEAPHSRLTLWDALELHQYEHALHLIREGHDPNERGGPYGSSPLGWAAFTGQTALVKELLALGAHVDVAAAMGSTALHMATWNDDNVELVQLLLDAKADASARNASGDRPLEHARQMHKIETSEGVSSCFDMDAWRARWGKGEAGRGQVLRLLADICGEDVDEKDAHSVRDEELGGEDGKGNDLCTPHGGCDQPFVEASKSDTHGGDRGTIMSELVGAAALEAPAAPEAPSLPKAPSASEVSAMPEAAATPEAPAADSAAVAE